MFGSLEVVALNLIEVARLEARHGVMQELQDVDRSLIGQRRQCDANGAGTVGHGATCDPSALGRGTPCWGGCGLGEDLQVEFLVEHGQLALCGRGQEFGGQCGHDAEVARSVGALVDGYEEFREFDRRELALIEPLRTLRLVHYSAWLAQRWHDPIFPINFPWFGSSDYWKGQVDMLEEQNEAMQESPLVV